MTTPVYGADYRRQRDALPLPAGDPCPFCRRPMWPALDPQTGRVTNLDADHTVPVAYGGADSPLRWSHRPCNRRAGGRLSPRFRRKGQRLPPPNLRRWA